MDNHSDINQLRQKYWAHPPDGISPDEILSMSEDQLLDMDFFFSDDDDPFF